jgi:hypothetical protein
MRSIGSATLHGGKQARQKRWAVLLTAALAILTAISGTLVLPRLDAWGTVSIELSAAQLAPTCSVVLPTASSVSGAFLLDAGAANANHVEYYLNGADLGPGVPTLYGWLYSPNHGLTYGWDSASVDNGSYAITCVATTSDGQQVTSSPVDVNVSNRVGCQVLLPSGGQSLSGIATLAAAAPSGTTGVNFYLHSSLEADALPGSGAAVATIYGWLYSPDGGRTYGWDSTPFPDGAYTITCEALESNGTTLASSPVALTLSNTKKIIIYGDSLSAQAYPFSSYLISSGGKASTVNDTFGGTAPCNWLSTMEADAAAVAEPPNAVIIQFSGNVSNCYSGNPAPESPALVADYRSDIQTAINAFTAHNIRVYLVGAPIASSQYGPPLDPNWDGFNQLYAQLAASDAALVTFEDAGAVVEGPTHTYVQHLQCLYFETSCNGPDYGAPTGTNVVRQPDGVHFCPVQITGTNPCPVYSSGALRYAMGEIGQVSHDLGL